jgi:hypothetical protein
MEEERKDPYSHYKEIALTQHSAKIKLLYLFIFLTLKKEHPALQNVKFANFFGREVYFWLFWI